MWRRTDISTSRPARFDVAAGTLDFADRYPIITGHFGGDWRRRFQRDGDRLAFTVIRDPVDRAISTYSFWRHRIRIGHPHFERPTIQAAKALSFADFIRSNDPNLKADIFNKHYSMLAGGDLAGTVREPEAQARNRANVAALAAEFDVIGTTERLPEALRGFLRAIGLRRQPDIRSLLAQVARNASPRLDVAEISSADRSFIAERNQLDFELHAIAGARLDRLLQEQDGPERRENQP